MTLQQPHISELRRALLDSIREVRSGQITPDQARAVSQLGAVAVETARIEVEYRKQAGDVDQVSGFIDDSTAPGRVVAKRRISSGTVMQLNSGAVVHRMDSDEEDA